MLMTHFEKFFPAILILLDFVAASIYYLQLDWRRGTYYILAGLIIVVVSF
jgi:hypothetical protein